MAEQSITDILRKRLSPEKWQRGCPPLLVATSRWQQMRERTDFSITPRKLHGPRKAVRKFTFGGWRALWQEDKLIETHAPLLMVVLEGVTDYCCGDYMIQIPAGNAILVPSGVPRRDGALTLEDISDNPLRHSDNILFSEHCGSLEIWLNHDRGNKHYRSQDNEILMVNSTQAIQLISALDAEAIAARPYYEKMLPRLCELFLWSLQRAITEKKALNPGRIPGNEQTNFEQYDPIHIAQQYVREHLDEQLTQDKLAQIVRLSRTQFIRRFHEETGQTFNRFVTDCRIEHAKVLLADTNFTLRFISESLGLKSSTYFNTLFQKQTGISPRKYRHENKDRKI